MKSNQLKDLVISHCIVCFEIWIDPFVQKRRKRKYTLILMMMTTIIRSSIISITLHQQQGNEATSGDDEWLRGRLNSDRGSLQVPAS